MLSLKERIVKHFTRVTSNQPLMMGIEHEFFLLTTDQMPVTHKQSQLFLKALSKFGNLNFAQDPNLGSYIESVANHSANTIKYDHHSFLFEIATAPSTELAVQQNFLNMAIDAISEAAQMLNLEISFDPFLPISTDREETKSELQFRKNLIDYRRKLFQIRNQPIDEALINYAAGIISTQVHIGGVPFEQYDSIFPELYRREHEVIEWANKTVISKQYANAKIMEKREQVYRSTFLNSPLVGFPAFEWTKENWLDALMKTPLYGSSSEYFSAYTLEDFPELDAMDEMDFLYRVRDLQWIKPHRQGTIEFRSTPAMPNVDSIMELCQMRLDTVKELMK